VPLIQTKMTPPPNLPGCVKRHALLDRFEERQPRSITMVTGPAGFGKTTLLADWSEALSEQNHPVAWLSVDGEDDDPQQFGAYLVAAFSRTSEDIARPAQELLNHDALTPVTTILSVLLNGIAEFGESVFLVLDDVDRLTAKPVLAMVSRLLLYAPENMHILLGARGEPAFTPGQLRAPEKLIRIDVNDLRFSSDDAHAFFEQTARLSLDHASVELLNETAEGWVTGLQLASLALRHAGDAAGVDGNLAAIRSGIYRYLDDAVLAHLPPGMLRFLLYTSILERLSPAVCDAVMGGGSGSAEKLAWLERHNAFIQAPDEKRDWYHYHSLLSSALERRLIRQMPAEVPLLHRRACEWFASAGLWSEAVRHALAAGELEQAAQWAENCAMEMMEGGDPLTLLGWIGTLPEDVANGRLRLRLAKAWAFALTRQTARASAEIAAVIAGFDQVPGHSDAIADEVALAEINALSALIACYSDDSERALELGRAAEASMAVAPAWVKPYAQTGQLFGLMYRGEFEQIRHMWEVTKAGAQRAQKPGYSEVLLHEEYGVAAHLHGELCEARRIFEQTLERAENLSGRCSAGAAALAGRLASICYERNELLAARKLIEGRTKIALDAFEPGGLILSVMTAARLQWRDGHADSALAMLRDGRQAAITRQCLRVKLACDAETVRLLLAEGHVTQARQIASELHAGVPVICEGRTGAAVESCANYCLLQARVLIAEGRADEAIPVLERTLKTVIALGWRCHEAVISVLLSYALEQCSASERAFVTLGRALRVGAARGMINSFVDEGAPVHALLRWYLRFSGNASNVETAYANTLLGACGHACGSSAASSRPSRPRRSRQIFSALESPRYSTALPAAFRTRKLADR
jgi:LuxR family maltose regulon positive regulatory protein